MTKSGISNASKHNPWILQYDEALQQYYYVNPHDNSISFDLPCEVNFTPESPKTKSKRIINLNNLKRKQISENPCSMFFNTNNNESTKKRSMLSRISSALSIKSSRSHDSTNTNGSQDSSQESKDTHMDAKDTKSVYQEGSGKVLDDQSSFNRFDEYYDNLIDQSFNIPKPDKANSIISGLDDEYLLDNPFKFKNFAGTSTVYYDSDLESVDSDQSIHSYYSEVNNYYYYADDGIVSEFNNDLSFDKEEERRELRLQILRELET